MENNWRFLILGIAAAVCSLPSCSLQEVNKQIGVPLWGQSSAADPSKRHFTRDKAIETHLQGRSLADIEGVWVWSDNQYEVVIFRNTTSPDPDNRYPGYDFVGLITDARDERDRREVKLLLKETASPTIYSGLFVDSGGARHGTAFVMTNKNLIEASVPTGPYRTSQKLFLLRMYPKSAEAAGTSRSSGTGTGFFIAPDIVATNYHVVANAKDINLRIGKVKLVAELVVQDRQNDLALLKVKYSGDAVADATLKSSISCASFAPLDNPKPGQTVFVLGYPLSGMLGSDVTVSQGIINSVVGIKDDPTHIQISVPIQPGNSGSPLFNEQGQIVGIVTSMLSNRLLLQTQGVVPQNVNFAVKAAYLKTLLGMTPNQPCREQQLGRLDAANVQGLLGSTVVAVEVARR